MLKKDSCSKMPVIERMRATLCRVNDFAGEDFSGIGLIVHNPKAKLPTFPLRLDAKPPVGDDLEKSLAVIASNRSDFHDGFHLLSVSWNLTAIAQYFSPPILANAEINWSRKFGGRYLAAQFGSALPGVVICGIATPALGLAIFEAGREIHFEKF
jgi:hypothetical protein